MTTTTTSITRQPQEFHFDFQIQGTPVEIETQIDAAARKIIATPMPSAEKQQALSELLTQRAHLLAHVPVNGLKGSVLFLNMTQISLAPTPQCPYYKKMRLPTISTYHIIGSNIASIKLDPCALRHVPRLVLEKAGDLSSKQVDLFWTAIDGRIAVREDRCMNLCTHTWVHPAALMGDEIKQDIQMGIFPDFGIMPHRGAGAIAVNDLSLMNVETHLDLYSPDNAHLERIPNSPFGCLWSVLKKDNRVAITKMLVLL